MGDALTSPFPARTLNDFTMYSSFAWDSNYQLFIFGITRSIAITRQDACEATGRLTAPKVTIHTPTIVCQSVSCMCHEKRYDRAKFAQQAT